MSILNTRFRRWVAISLNLARRLRPNVAAIVHYAFTEMLNNAIEHSGAKRCRVEVRLETGQLSFEIRESGIGVFRSIAEKLGLPDEHFRVKGRTKWYETVEEMQKDLDAYLEHYNRKRPHQGRGMNGKMPYAMFVKGLPKGKKQENQTTNKAA